MIITKTKRTTKTTTLLLIATLLCIITLYHLVTTITASTSTTTTTSSTPSQQEDPLVLGDALFRQSNYSGALNEYSKLGNDVRALIKKAEIYRLERKFDFVKVECQRIVDNSEGDSSKNLAAYLLLAEVNLLMGEFEDAVKNAKKAVEFDEEHSSNAQSILANAQKALELYSSVSHVIHNAEESGDSSSSSSVNTSDYLKCSQVLLDLLNTYAKESMELRLSRAKCALLAKQFSLVPLELKKIFARDKNYVPANLLYAKYLYMLGAADQARNHIKTHCLNSDPENRQCKQMFRWIKKAEQLSEKALSDVQSDNWTSAKQSISEYIEFSPQAYNIEQMRANYCRALAKTCNDENFEAAVKVCNAVINEVKEEEQQEAISTEFVTLARLGKAEAYLNGGEIDNAEREVEAIRSSKSIPQNLHDQFNQLLQRIKREKKMASQKDYYKLLGLDKTKKSTYTAKDIKSAYRKMTMKYHPDRLEGEDKKAAAKKYSAITQAYEILSDEEKRARYDSGEWDGNEQQGGGHPGGFPGGGGGFPGGFEQFFTQQGAGAGGFRFNFG